LIGRTVYEYFPTSRPGKMSIISTGAPPVM
jgi:hypothetical protein